MAPKGTYIAPRTRFVLETTLCLLPPGIAVALAYFSETGFLTAVGLFGLALVLSAVVNYWLVYSHAVSFRNRRLTSFLNHHLELLVNDYEERYADNCSIRANVIIPQQRRTISHKGGLNVEFETEEFLQIAYSTDDYQPIELNREWSLDQGWCGKAYAENVQYEAKQSASDGGWSQPWGTTPEQDKATEHLRSVLSTPVYKPSDEAEENPIAILNLESESSITETGLHGEEVQDEVAERYAAEIGTLL